MTPINEREFTKSSAGWFYQFGLIFRRNMIVYLRIPQTSFLKLLMPVLIASLVSSMFYGLTGDLTGVRNRNGVMFFLDISSCFVAL